ncbi:MAG TPA: hypothetical protein VKT22_00700 [Steroidobacteraceae bacterium]|nr:hypothetical protein [Steroidobacteraceae bacterium]
MARFVLYRRWQRLSGWWRELTLALIALIIGCALMPLLIFLAGSSMLGRYEGASAALIYRSVFSGLANCSPSAWIVFLGPYGLYVLFRLLTAWWRVGSAYRT